MLPPGAICDLKYTKMRMRPMGFTWDPTLEAYRAPRPPSWFSGSRFTAGEGRKGEREGGRIKREGLVFPHFLKFNDCSAVIVAATYTRSLNLALQLVCRSICRQHAD